MKYDVVLLTDDEHLQPATLSWYNLQVLLEDEMVRDSLEQQSLKTARVSWSDKQFDWSSTRSVLFRTTWDYFDRFDEFYPWFNHIKSQTRLINDQKTIEWNLDKRYLLDLEFKGINIVNTRILEQLKPFELDDYFSEFDVDELIVKPVVSGAARHTYRVNKSNKVIISSNIEQLLTKEHFMVQPFQMAITKQGEISMMVMGGEFTHAVRKVAKSGDFRVQDDFGGTVEPYFPNKEEIDFAIKAVQACDPQPLYARVDMIYNNEQQLAIMELELIEPELFFRFNRAATFPLAAAVKKLLDDNG